MSEGRIATKVTEPATVEVLIRMNDYWSDNERQQIAEKYRRTEENEKMTGIKHRMITGYALHLAKSVMAKGGTEDEVKKALTYLMICIDAKKKILDTLKAFNDLGIDKLQEKYSWERRKEILEKRQKTGERQKVN